MNNKWDQTYIRIEFRQSLTLSHIVAHIPDKCYRPYEIKNAVIDRTRPITTGLHNKYKINRMNIR